MWAGSVLRMLVDECAAMAAHACVPDSSVFEGNDVGRIECRVSQG